MPSNSGSVIEGVISVDADAGLLAAVRARPSGQGARSQRARPVPRVRSEGASRRVGQVGTPERVNRRLSLTAGPENRIGVLTSGPEQGSKLLKSHRARLAQRLPKVNVC
jgi:hypothetical protein